MLVESTINAQSSTYLTEKELAELILAMRFEPRFALQIFNFFTEVALEDVEEFAFRYRIPDEVLKRYYEKYVKECYPSAELEEMLDYVEKTV